MGKKNRKSILYAIILGMLSFTMNAQEGLHFKKGITKDKIRFKLTNNLITIPVKINDTELTFLVDTGVNSTIVFSLEQKDSVEFKNASKILIRGLGKGEPIEGIKSMHNRLEIGNAVNNDQTIYLVFDETMNLSPRMGFPVHGIIGYDFFKNFIAEVNYSRKVIKITSPETYKYKRCKKCFSTEIFLRNSKPYIKTILKQDKKDEELTLLVDSGSGAALWLFENVKERIEIAERFFEDYLGRGLNGEIYGVRSKVKHFSLGNFDLKEVTASFPDSIYTRGVRIADRQGSIGGNLMKRFNMVIDYPNKKMTFKKNKYFSRPFNYNMSGLTIIHSGFDVVERRTGSVSDLRAFSLNFNARSHVEKSKNALYQLLYSLQPKFEIFEVRPDSPAALAGLQKGDVLIKVNNKPAKDYSLSVLNDLFYSKEGKRIKMEIERNGVRIKYIFYLKKVI